jgi:DUF2950 family protein
LWQAFHESKCEKVYEKDLGPKTNVIAGTIKEYNPNSSWQEAEDQQEEIAGTKNSGN